MSAALWDKLENVPPRIWHHPHWAEGPGDTVALVSELSGWHRGRSRGQVTCFTSCFRTCIWKVFRGALRSKWKYQGLGHFWVTAETKSIQWKNSNVLHSQTLWMLGSQIRCLVTCKVWLNFEVNIWVLMHLNYWNAPHFVIPHPTVNQTIRHYRSFSSSCLDHSPFGPEELSLKDVSCQSAFFCPHL